MTVACYRYSFSSRVIFLVAHAIVRRSVWIRWISSFIDRVTIVLYSAIGEPRTASVPVVILLALDSLPGALLKTVGPSFELIVSLNSNVVPQTVYFSTKTVVWYLVNEFLLTVWFISMIFKRIFSSLVRVSPERIFRTSTVVIRCPIERCNTSIFTTPFTLMDQTWTFATNAFI